MCHFTNQGMFSVVVISKYDSLFSLPGESGIDNPLRLMEETRENPDFDATSFISSACKRTNFMTTDSK
jgi:hypothetical protein